MQATTALRPDMPQNQERFQEPFFKRFALRPIQRSVELENGVAKTYDFPTLYGDVGCAIGIFMCDWDAAKRIMPHPKILPVRMPLGRSLVIFSCYEYRNVHQVWPYNEIAMTIPVMANARRNVPVLPMLADKLFPRFGYYVFGMPVTSRENQLRGNRIWGLPKVTQAIDIDASGDDCVTVARETDGTPYFELRVPKRGTPAAFDVSGHLYSKLDGKILKSKTCFKGGFFVNKGMRALIRRDLRPAHPALTIGSTASADVLGSLGIEPMPFQTRYTPSMNAAFDLPIPGYDVEAQ